VIAAKAQAPRDAALRALAEVLAPLVVEILREQGADDGDDALAELLARAGYEIAPDEAGELGPAGVAKAKTRRNGRAA
jgi:hypothetical protein